jgi:hypothetical protein
LRRSTIKEDEIMSVALAQPHRRGVSSHPADAWQTTALGRLTRLLWSWESAKEHWIVGERFARLVDAERIARGFTPRQCAEIVTSGSSMTDEEKKEARQVAEGALNEAKAAIRAIDGEAVQILYQLAWEDRDAPRSEERHAYNGLYALRLHFEAVDRPKVKR